MTDLGTYHVRVELEDGRGWISKWNTGRRYTGGTQDESPLDAGPMLPVWSCEEDLFNSMLFIFTEGNYSCDCNKTLFLARAYQQDEPDDPPCGDTMTLARLTAIRPDGTEKILYPEATERAAQDTRSIEKETND